MEDFFQQKPADTLSDAPLSTRMRPESLEEYVGQTHILGPGKLLRRAIEAGDVEEERRLFYVACTRAENMLFLFAPRFAVSGEGYRPLDPCRFLEEMSPDCYELADYAHRRL